MSSNCLGKSAGAIIKKDGKILFLDRAFFPLGWAPPAGHINPGEEPINAIIREVKEETDLDVVRCKLLLNEKNAPDPCVKGGKFHDVWVFECECRGEINLNEESNDFAWISKEEIKTKRDIISVWQYFFKKLEL